MNNTDPLAQLRDIHLPAEVSWWPLAPGWWILIVLGLALFAAGIYWLVKRWRASVHKRAAIRSLELSLTKYKRSKNNGASQDYISSFSETIRRVALVSFPQQQVASLTGNTWLDFLDQSGNTKEFSSGAGKVIAMGPYQENADFKPEELHKLGINWIKKHKAA